VTGRIDAVELGREAYARAQWREAYDLFTQAAALDAPDLARLAIAAHLLGLDDECTRVSERAHGAYLDAGDLDSAVRWAFWLGFAMMLRGEMAQASGWLARGERIAKSADRELAARGLLLVPVFLHAHESGDRVAAERIAHEILEIAQRTGDPDVLALGLLCLGEALLTRGDTHGGMKLLDEAMVSVKTSEISPMAAGVVYCAVIEACMHASDLRRASEWTDALADWCAAQPDLVPYRGQCMVHRSQVLQARGSWAEAMVEAERARERLTEPAHPALGTAYYQRGELRRLRGEFDAAERDYRSAHEHGREPAPGLALLRLAEGKGKAALASVQRMVEESEGTLAHATMLIAAAEITLVAGDINAARETSERLAAVAEARDVPLLHAAAAAATGAVLRVEGKAREALAVLRLACAAWRDLEMPYEAARVQVEIAIVYRALGDPDAADLELDAARTTFDRLHAQPDVARVDALRELDRPAPSGVLTDRECEVLRLVAAGKTNRAIAADLVISEHTVARHLQNIFLKLDLSSRAAATAYAYEHGLVGGVSGR
jgi:ATP/maltotriose-dependent transcriptional regulator MalT